MPERARQGGWSIQAQFLLYSSALLIPTLVFSGLMIVRSASLERAAMEGEINDVVGAVALAIDRELAATTTTLNALASSPALTDGDLKAFYSQAIAAQEVSGNQIFLTSRSGKQLLDTRVPWGAELPSVSSDRLERGHRVPASRRCRTFVAASGPAIPPRSASACR